MAKVTHTILVDDLDGGDATQTIAFGVGPRIYDIDLNDENADVFRQAMQPYVDHGRERKGSLKRQTMAGRKDYDVDKLRKWAAEEGIEVAARGRIKTATIEQYKASRSAL